MPIAQQARSERAREQDQVGKGQSIDDPDQQSVVLAGLRAGRSNKIMRRSRNGIPLRGFAQAQTRIREPDQRQDRHKRRKRRQGGSSLRIPRLSTATTTGGRCTRVSIR